MTWTCASKESLLKLKDVDEALADQIRAVWKAVTQRELEKAYPQVEERIRECYHAPKFVELKRWAIDRMLNTCGVEFLGVHKRSGRDVFYCNAGGSYATTIIFTSTTLTVGCWADLVESRAVCDPTAAELYY